MTQDLTTLARVKSWSTLPNINTADDQLLSDLISGASDDIIRYLDRKNIYRTTFSDYMDGNGGIKMPLKQWPVISVNSLSIDGVSQTAATPPSFGYFLDPWDGQPPGGLQYVSIVGSGVRYRTNGSSYFCRGVRNVYVSYVAGYCVTDEEQTIPATPYAITTDQINGKWMQDDGVTYAATGISLTAVNGTPATGQYNAAGGVYTFAAADTGLDVLISYSYVPKALEEACVQRVGEMYAYRQHVGQKMHTLSGNTTVSFDSDIMTKSILHKLQPFKRMVPY